MTTYTFLKHVMFTFIILVLTFLGAAFINYSFNPEDFGYGGRISITFAPIIYAAAILGTQ